MQTKEIVYKFFLRFTYYIERETWKGVRMFLAGCLDTQNHKTEENAAEQGIREEIFKIYISMNPRS